MSSQLVQLLHERVHILETAINGSESDVGDRIELAQPLDDHPADRLAGDFALRRVLHGLFDEIGQPFELLLRHRPFAAGHLQAAHQFRAVVRLAALVALDHLIRNLLDALVTREAALALGALAPPTDDVRLTALSRIDYAVFRGAAERAAHSGGRISRVRSDDPTDDPQDRSFRIAVAQCAPLILGT